MKTRSRWTWLLLPVAVGIAWRLALWIYWFREREAWIRRHGGGTTAAAFGEGKLDAQAVFLTLGSWCLVLIFVAFVPAPPALQVFAIGVLAVPLAVGIEFLGGQSIGRLLGNLPRSQGPTLAGILVLVSEYVSRTHSAGPK